MKTLEKILYVYTVKIFNEVVVLQTTKPAIQFSIMLNYLGK